MGEPSVEPRRVFANALFDARAATIDARCLPPDEMARAFVNPIIRRAFGIAVALALVMGGLGLLQISSFAEDRAA